MITFIAITVSTTRNQNRVLKQILTYNTLEIFGYFRQNNFFFRIAIQQKGRLFSLDFFIRITNNENKYNQEKSVDTKFIQNLLINYRHRIVTTGCQKSSFLISFRRNHKTSRYSCASLHLRLNQMNYRLFVVVNEFFTF